MKKGGNDWHGSVFASYEDNKMDAAPTNYLRYDPNGSAVEATRLDAGAQEYQPIKDHYRYVQPGAYIGGPIVKDRVWFFLGFAPQYNATSRNVNFASQGFGLSNFTQDQQTYYGTGRIDATLTQKIRVFGSWLTQYARETGANLPNADSIQDYTNTSVTTPITAFAHGIGWAAPNQTFNIGSDITITPRLVSTTRFGYFFENYHDFGYPQQGDDLQWRTNGASPTVDNTGLALPAGLQQPRGTQTLAYNADFTSKNANKHYQFDEDLAAFKSGWWGTHNFKFGYQLNHLVNDIHQNGNVPLVRLYLGNTANYSPSTTYGSGVCATLEAGVGNGNCAGQYGYMQVDDFGTTGIASDTNHGFFIQDAWTIGKGVTIDAGVRIEKEQIPAPKGNVLAGHTINFGWGDKIAPRLGAAWDVMQNGKVKVFGSYGVTNDIMKLLLAMTSFGGQAYEECSYALGPNNNGGFDPTAINAAYIGGRACPSAAANVGANWASGSAPSGVNQLIENINLRPYEPVAPGVKPYRQHESVFGVDVQLAKNYAFEARWDRRRLDHILEDASLADTNWGETYTIVNPGEGVNKTLNGYANYLGSLGQVFGVPGWSFDPTSFGTCTGCPNNPKAVRSYDGLELRLTKSISNHWSGMFSYTYSSLRGNYSGLTTSDQTDGGDPGRNSPDTSRAFDEPFFYYTAAGKSANGPLPTDRPNTFKGYAYYQLSEGKRNSTTFGLFQTVYQGSPVSSYIDTGDGFAGQVSFAPYNWGRGKWVDATADASGNITLGQPYSRRTPWYTQSDVNLMHEIKVDKNNERHVFGIEANFTNLFNQHAVTAYNAGINSVNVGNPLYPGVSLATGGAAAYQRLETGYSVQNYINQTQTIDGNTLAPAYLSSWYGMPMSHQLGRTIRLKLRYTF